MDYEIEAQSNLKSAKSYTSCSLQDAVKLRPYTGQPATRRIQTIPEFFHDCCHKYKNRPALAYKETDKDEEWTILSYEEYEEKVKQAALLLHHLGVQTRSTVAILSSNCPEWFYVQLAALRIGAVVAGIYTSNSAEAVYHVLETSEASLCLVDDSLQMSKIHEIKTRLTHLKAVIQIHGPFKDYIQQDSGYYRWLDLFEMKFDGDLSVELLKRESKVYANECALLIFTTDNLLFCCHGFTKTFPTPREQQESIVTYLPLNHIAAQIFDFFIALENGLLVYFADRNALKGTLAQTYQKAKATILVGVPRVYEKLQEQFIKSQLNASFIKRFLMSMARSFTENYHLGGMSGKTTSRSWKYWLASLVIRKIKMSMGLGYIKKCFVGGAPLTAETKKFFLSLDLPLIDVFGMSEVSGAVTFNFDQTNLQTLGKPIEGVEFKIHTKNDTAEGEILLRGPCTFMGYLKEPVKTQETFTPDDWLKTGDLGYLDNEGNLYISGRLKELIITAGGENIPPVYIEEIIKKELPCLSNALVIGDHKKYLTVLLTFKTDIDANTGYPLETLRPEAIEWLETLDVRCNKLSHLLNINLPQTLENVDPTKIDVKCDPKVWQALDKGIKRYNMQAISNAQKIQYFSILPHDFSTATGELGPTLKIRRNIVQQKYAEIIDKMYNK